MTARHLFVLGIALAFAQAGGCSGAQVGRLAAEAGPGYDIVPDAAGGKAAVLHAGTLTVRVGGSWAAGDLQALEVSYGNEGAVPIRIPTEGFSLVSGTVSAAIDGVSDITGVSVADKDPTNDTVTTPAPGTPLTIAPGKSRTLRVTFSNFQTGPVPAAGTVLTAGIPLPAQIVHIRFRCAGSDGL